MGVPPVKIGPHPYLFFEDHPKAILHSGGQTNKPKEPSLWSAFGLFLFQCPQYLSAELASPMPVASNFCVVEFVRWGYFWGDNNFWGWCYVIGLEFVCAYARIVIFS